MLLHFQREPNIRDATASKTAKKWSVPEWIWVWGWRTVADDRAVAGGGGGGGGQTMRADSEYQMPGAQAPGCPGSSNRIYLPMPGIPTSSPLCCAQVTRLIFPGKNSTSQQRWHHNGCLLRVEILSVFYTVPLPHRHGVGAKTFFKAKEVRSIF